MITTAVIVGGVVVGTLVGVAALYVALSLADGDRWDLAW